MEIYHLIYLLLVISVNGQTLPTNIDDLSIEKLRSNLVYIKIDKPALALGPREYHLNVTLHNPCPTQVARLTATIREKLKEITKVEAEQDQWTSVFSDRLTTDCNIRMNTRIIEPTMELCRQIKRDHSTTLTLNPIVIPGLFSTDKWWKDAIIGGIKAISGAFVIGTNLAKADYDRKLGEVIDKVNQQFNLLALQNKKFAELINFLVLQSNYNLENTFRNDEYYYLIKRSQEHYSRTGKLSYEFLEWFKALDEYTTVEEMKLLGCTLQQEHMIIKYRMPVIAPKILYKIHSINMDINGCTLEYIGPRYAIVSDKEKFLCFVDMQIDAPEQFSIIKTPQCIEKSFTYDDLHQRNCQSPTKNLNQIFVDGIGVVVVYCKGNFELKQKVYKCPETPFKITRRKTDTAGRMLTHTIVVVIPLKMSEEPIVKEYTFPVIEATLDLDKIPFLKASEIP